MLKSQHTLLALEEVVRVHLKIKLVHLMLSVLADMYQRLVPILLLNKTSQDGHCQKLVDPIMTQRSLIEIRPMTLGHRLVNNATQKIHQQVKLILALPAEKLHRD